MKMSDIMAIADLVLGPTFRGLEIGMHTYTKSHAGDVLLYAIYRC